MMEDVKLTQEATQPPVRAMRSMRTIPDAEDIICILRPNSPAALHIIEYAARTTPQHVLFDTQVETDSDDDIRTDDGEDHPEVARPRKPLSLALRMSSNIRDLAMGFVFGREPTKCDITLKTGFEDYRISSRHFRIYLNDAHVLMVEDHSTNGIRVDRHYITCKMPGNSKRFLGEGTQVSVTVFGDRETRTTEEATFTVAMPERNTREYTENFKAYIQRIENYKIQHKLPGKAEKGFTTASTIPFNQGMHWNGAPNYRVLKLIGRGAFANVYQLATLSEGELFAVKEIDLKRVIKEGLLGQEANKELAIMKKLSHSHVVQFVDWHQFESHLYIIMDFVPGGDLSTYTSASCLLSKSDVRQVANQISQALQYIHARKVTHRDVKPDNVLVQSTRPLHVKLTDFGLSKMIQGESLLKTFCGTLLYCAPEVYPDFDKLRQGEPRLPRNPGRTSPYSSAVDIWSLGAVLYQLSSSHAPIKGASNSSEMLEAILKNNIDYQPLRDNGVGEDALDFLDRMLTIDACDRISATASLKHPWLYDLNATDSQLAMRPKAEKQNMPIATLVANEASEDSTPKSNGGLFGAVDLSGSFNRAAAGLLASPEAAMDSSADSIMGGLPRPNLNEEEDEFSQWSPRDPIPATTNGSDSDEILPDVQETANQIAAGTSLNGGNASSRASSSLVDFGFGQPGQAVQDSFSSNSDFGRSMITDLTPQQAFELRRQNQHQGTAEPLFGEVASSGLPESGIFGREPRPLIRHARDEPRESSLYGAETKMDILHVSPPQNGFRTEPDRPLPTALPKRILELSGDQEEKDKMSKRSMTRQYRVPSTHSLAHQILNAPNRRLFGRLIPCPGSFANQVIEIDSPCIMWGRFLTCTHVYRDNTDTRVPKRGIEITFFSPGLWATPSAPPASEAELHEADAIITTSSRQGILVNGVRLCCFAKNGGAFQCGKLRSGDVIQVFRDKASFLCFECEFYVGQSAPIRGDNEPFMVEENAELAAAAADWVASKDASNAEQKVKKETKEEPWVAVPPLPPTVSQPRDRGDGWLEDTAREPL